MVACHLNTPAAPSNFCREPKDVLFDIHNTFMKLMKMQLGSLKNCNFEPCIVFLQSATNARTFLLLSVFYPHCPVPLATIYVNNFFLKALLP